MKRIKRKTLLEEKIGCHEWMMYDESQKMVYLLNDTAFFIYGLCQDIAPEMVVQEYVRSNSGLGIPPGVMVKEVHEILEYMKKESIIWEEDFECYE